MRHRSTIAGVTLVLVPGLLTSLGGCGARQVSGLSFHPQAGWVEEEPEPEHSSRVAQFSLPAPERGVEDARLVVHYFGPAGAGSVAENIDRYRSHFEPAPGERTLPFDVGRRERHGLTLDTIEAAGTYVAPLRPSADDRHHKPDHRLLATIVTTEAGPYYVTLEGPGATVGRWEKSYRRFVDSLRSAPVVKGEAIAVAPHP